LEFIFWKYKGLGLKGMFTKFFLASRLSHSRTDSFDLVYGSFRLDYQLLFSKGVYGPDIESSWVESSSYILLSDFEIMKNILSSILVYAILWRWPFSKTFPNGKQWRSVIEGTSNFYFKKWLLHMWHLYS